jgi:hypothetical protein
VAEEQAAAPPSTDVVVPINVRLGTVDGHEVTLAVGFEPDTDDIETIRTAPEPHNMSPEGQANHRWFHSLSEQHQPYFLFLLHADRLWPQFHDHPPVWVHVDGHPDLEQALAEHFGVRGNTVEIVDADTRHQRFAAAVAAGKGNTVR